MRVAKSGGDRFAPTGTPAGPLTASDLHWQCRYLTDRGMVLRMIGCLARTW
jgi:hypothetical protein